jgi:hypothetical protein
MQVISEKENDDGSADFTFDMTDDEVRIMFENGIKAVMLEFPEDHCTSQYKAAKDAIIQLGIMDAIVKGIKSVEKSQTTSTQE